MVQGLRLEGGIIPLDATPSIILVVVFRNSLSTALTNSQSGILSGRHTSSCTQTVHSHSLPPSVVHDPYQSDHERPKPVYRRLRTSFESPRESTMTVSHNTYSTRDVVPDNNDLHCIIHMGQNLLNPRNGFDSKHSQGVWNVYLVYHASRFDSF